MYVALVPLFFNSMYQTCKIQTNSLIQEPYDLLINQED
jgi:hypothetical protein